jgi:hypothetical protein
MANTAELLELQASAYLAVGAINRRHFMGFCQTQLPFENLLLGCTMTRSESTAGEACFGQE